MNTQLFINTAAQSLSAALVRSLTDMTPISLPQLVIGDNRAYDLFLVDGLGGYASFSGDPSYIPNLAIGSFGFPTGGTFTLTFGANTTSALNWNATTAQVQAALQALASIGSNNCLVTGVPGEYYIVTFVGTLAAAPQSDIVAHFNLLTPDSTIDVSTVVVGTVSPAVNAVQLLNFATNPMTFADNWTTITNGWTGKLSLRTMQAVEALAAAGAAGLITALFQITVQAPSGDRSTYFEGAVSIYDSIINPESFAGADKPLLATQAALNAAVLGLNNFTAETDTPASPGNTNISPPSSSRYHSAKVTPSGGAGTYTLALLTSQTPATGALIHLAIFPPSTAALVFEVHNATAGGTLLKTITTDATGRPFFLDFEFNGSAWVLSGDDSALLNKLQNLAGLASTLTSKVNLGNLFSQKTTEATSWTIVPGDEGKLFDVTAAGGAVLATLPAAATAGDGFLVALRKTDSSANAVTTSPATWSLTALGDLIVLRSDGSTWSVILFANTSGSGGTVTAAVLRLNAVTNGHGLTGLVGGGATNLDGLATADGTYQVGAVVAVILTGPKILFFRLRAGTDAQNSPWIVRPADYNGTTNQLVWEFLTMTSQGYPCVWNSTQSKFQTISSTGGAGAEVISFGTGFSV
jgi:hypothetical protein